MAIGEPMVWPWRTPDRIWACRFDLHAPAAAKSLLAPPKLAVHEFEVDRHAGRHAGDQGDQGLSVGLTGGEKRIMFF